MGKGEALVISQKPKTYSLFLFFLFVVSARIFLTALAFAQTAPLPEPPQAQAKHHVVS